MNSLFFERVGAGAAELFRSSANQMLGMARWSRDNAGFIVKWVALAVLAFVIIRSLLFYFGYEMALGYLWGTLGFDKTLASPIAFFVAVLALAFGPSVIWYALYWKRKRELVAVGAIISGIWILGAFFIAHDVFVDRISGVYTKCYLKTLEGFKFSSTCDFDPETGVQFQKLTPEVMEEYSFWKKNGKFASFPVLEEGKFFDILTGRPIVWYVERFGGRIALSPLPGFDPVSGLRLKPITREIIEQYNLAGAGQTVTRITPPISAREAARITEEVESALEYVQEKDNGITLLKVTQDRIKEQKKVIWKWYATQPAPLDSRAESVVVRHAKRHDDQPSINVSFQVEPVVRVGAYIIIPVACRNASSTEEARLEVSLQVLDRDLHPFKHDFEVYETPMISDLWGAPDNGRTYYKWHLNPNESSRILFVVKNADYEQVRKGALSVRGQIARYW